MVGHQVGYGAGEHNIPGDAERAGPVQPGKAMIRGHREDRARLFLEVCINRTRVNGQVEMWEIPIMKCGKKGLGFFCLFVCLNHEGG